MFLYQLHANRHFFCDQKKISVYFLIMTFLKRGLYLQLKTEVNDLCCLVDWF